MKIGVIGIGHVGAHVVSAIVQKNLASELYLYDLNEEKLVAEINDLEQASLLETTNPRFIKATLNDLLGCDIVVNTASKRIINGDRLKELEGTKEIVESIFKNFNVDNFKGIIINISNPCDVVSYLIHKVTGIPANRIIGTGTLLDTMRLKVVLAKFFSVSPRNVSVLVMGEHGNSQLNVYSQCSIYGNSLTDYLKNKNLSFSASEIGREVMNAGWSIFSVKGATEFGIGSVTAHLIACIKNDQRCALPYSHIYNYKGKTIYTSTPALIGREGFIEEVYTKLNAEEEELFAKSCAILADVIATL